MKADNKIVILDGVEQGTPEWFVMRTGRVTASELHNVIAEPRAKGGPSLTRQKYMRTLVGEMITGVPNDVEFQSAAMLRGKRMEAEARDAYQLITEHELRQVSFVQHGSRRGCSPDALIGKNGGLELKTKTPHLQIELLLSQEFPTEHLAQCQGIIWLAGLEWIDFVSYWPGIKMYRKRIVRDEPYISKLKSGVDKFLEEADAMMRRLAA